MTTNSPEVIFERKYGRILSEIEGKGESMSVRFTSPKDFKKMLNDISIGDIYYREFYTDVFANIVSIHCKMTEGSVLKTHRHPNCDTYIYVIQGKLIEHLTDDIIVPPDEHLSVKELLHNKTIHAWYKVPAGTLHMLQADAPNTQFVLKFVNCD